MQPYTVEQLHAFIVKAKAATYVGDGKKLLSYRPGSHDLQFHEEPFVYMDSYFGGTDFIGQEVVYFESQPVWAMNYYGYILRDDLITAAEAGHIIKMSLSQLYREGRFLGGWQYRVEEDVYTDTNEGDAAHFSGKEWITRQNIRVYELVYHGGLIRS
jgi:hypothetical protein